MVDHNETDSNWPMWMWEAYNGIVEICNSIGFGAVSDQLRAFSKLLHEKNLLVQSIIALCCAYEARVVEQINPKLVGRYNLWRGGNESQANGKLNELHISSDLRKAMRNLKDLRNKVAHGAGDQFSRGDSVTVESLRDELLDAESRVDEFFTLVQ